MTTGFVNKHSAISPNWPRVYIYSKSVCDLIRTHSHCKMSSAFTFSILQQHESSLIEIPGNSLEFDPVSQFCSDFPIS